MIILNIRNLIFRTKSKILREIFLFLKFRPASYPYISGDGFRAIADHIYDDIKTFDPTVVKEGDIIFVQTHSIKEYFEKVHPSIENKYKLITHNSDDDIREEESRYLDKKIIRWFAQNNIFAHPKITPIPIGLENEKWVMTGYSLRRILNKLRKESLIKKDRVLFGFNIKTNPKERTDAQENLRKCKVADEIMYRINPPDYFKLLNQYNFVASPPGNGTDCPRTWEALLLKAIPICKDSVMIRHFKSLGIPILSVENWNEVVELGENDLKEFYNQSNNRFNNEFLLMDSWVNLIKNTND